MTTAIDKHSIRGRKTFARGIHPPEYKELAADAAIEVPPYAPEVKVPILQHLGKPCKVVVKPRAKVVAGDVLGEADGFISSPVHAPYAGVVGRAGNATLPNGRHVTIIPVKADKEQPLEGQALYDLLIGGEWQRDGLDKIDPKEIFNAALQAGIVGLGGAAFPTHVKLTRNEKQPIEELLINGCECEPFLTADYRLMIESAGSIVAGALLAQQANGAKRVIICVEDNKPAAIAALQEAANGTSAEVEVLKTKYPQGGEKSLTVAVLGKEVPNGGLPLHVGVVVLNVGTVAALARAVLRKSALTHRVVTVTGSGINTPKNLLVPVGTPFQTLIDYCGGLNESAARVVAGGPMMGFTVGSLKTPVTKGTSGITVLSEAEVKRSAETSCVRCGRCVDVCPLKLVPTKLAMAARYGDTELGRRYHMMACMECGCCAYTCPAGIPLVQLIRMGKIKMPKK